MSKTDNFLPGWLVVLIVASFCFCSLTLTYLVRFSLNIPESETDTFIYVIPVVIICRCLSFYFTGFYKIANGYNISGWKMRLVFIQFIVSLFFAASNIILHLSPLKHYLMPYSIILIEYFLSTGILIMLMDKDARFSNQRNFGLDIVRALAIISVVIMHGGSLIVGHPGLLHIYSFFQIDGVTMFFALSGFLIGNILLKTINETDFTFKKLSGFWMRRWFRTLPNYYLVLLFLIFFYYQMDIKIPDDLRDYFFFSQSLTHPCTFKFFGVSWSLCIEEWFYLIIPIILFTTIHVARQVNKKEKILFCILFVIVSVILYRIFKIQTVGSNMIIRLDSIMYGVLGAYLYYYKIPIWWKYNNLFLISGILIILLFTYNIPGFNYSLATLLSVKPLGYLFVLPKLSSMEKTAWKGAKFITFISIISYSMYLLHSTVVLGIIMTPLCKLLDMGDVITYKVLVMQYLMYWVLTIMLSSLVYICFERPMTNLREKISV